MSVLAFKAIGYGAEQIPDKFFEKIPGGFFTPAENQKIKDNRDKKDRERHKSEQRSSKRSSRRDRSPPQDSEYSAYDDTDHENDRERERRKRDRRRAKSAGRSTSRSLSRGRHDRRSSDLDGQYSDSRDMAHAEQGGPYFPPPPTSDYRPYNPQDYVPGQPQGDYRPSSAGQPYGYPPQPAAAPPHSSASAARYTPGPGYAPSPPVNSNIPAPPIGADAPYSPYNPAEYAPNAGGYHAPGNAYASPPPLSRHRSNSQPVNPPYPAYAAPVVDQRMTAYDSNDQPSSRRGSTKPRREHRHRARSADTHSSSRKDYDHGHRRDSSRMTKLRERFDDGFLREGGLAATVGGALAGSIAGRQLGGGRNKLIPTILGGAAGAFGGRAIADKRIKVSITKSTAMRRNTDYVTGAEAPIDRARVRGPDHAHDTVTTIEPVVVTAANRVASVLEARASLIASAQSLGGPRTVILANDRHDRPDRGYDRGRGDEYDYFSSESEGDGSPVTTRRHRKRRDY